MVGKHTSLIFMLGAHHFHITLHKTRQEKGTKLDFFQTILFGGLSKNAAVL